MRVLGARARACVGACVDCMRVRVCVRVHGCVCGACVYVCVLSRWCSCVVRVCV